MSKRVLVVDDDDPGRRLVGEILSDAGFEVALAENGAAALEQAKTFDPDAMVVDLVMPEMDGFEFLLRARELPSADEVPKVVLSTSSFMGDLTVGTLGVRAAVAKPFELNELVTVVNAVLGEEPAS